MRRKVFAGLVAVIAGATIAACADAPSAPAPASPRDLVAVLAKGGNGNGNKPENGPPGQEGKSAESLLAYLSTLADTISRTTQSVQGMRRLLSLSGSPSASATIGAEGGMVSLPEAGAYLWVPPGAVQAPTAFSITAKSGKAVAYDFQPAGAKFTIPVVLIQDRSLLNPLGPTFLSTPALGYFASDADVDATTASGTASQLRGLLGISTPQLLAFPIWHFSGYIVCWGRGERNED